MPTKIEPTGSIRLIDDKGIAVNATIYTTLVEYQSDGIRSWLPGSKAYKLPSGGHLNPSDDGTFTDVSSNRVLRPAT
jgi:hypothetical protein